MLERIAEYGVYGLCFILGGSSLVMQFGDWACGAWDYFFKKKEKLVKGLARPL